MTLPKKPSKLLTVALQDLSKAEKNAKYSIYMNDWHDPHTEKCKVCLAGAVMAFSLNAPIQELLIPEDFADSLQFKLEAIDLFRSGNIHQGLELLGFEQNKFIPEEVEIVPYEYNKNEFKKDMRKLIKLLEFHKL